MTSIENSESLLLSLKELYQQYGYRQYKVGKFEEYDLYARFRDFLTGEHILTFSDLNGRLMALKPDVTLSIIKNTRGDDRIRKVWYTENVYRVPPNSNSYKEIRQAGLECIGAVDLYTMAEVLMLAARSLETISPAFVLELSHVGILSGILSSCDISKSLAKKITHAFSEKNIPALSDILEEAPGLDPRVCELMKQLCLLEGKAEDVAASLSALPLPDECVPAVEELKNILSAVKVFGDFHLSIDLSVTNNTEYYNGLIFRGYIDGIAVPVLSGGQYDHLLHHMDKKGGAVGFAIYMSELERMFSGSDGQDFDILLSYKPGISPVLVAQKVRSLVSEGYTVRAQAEGTPAVTYRKRIDLENEDTAT